MRLVTWNIRCQNASDDVRGCGWKARFPFIESRLQEMAPDILAVQEAYATQMRDLSAALPDYESAGVGRDDGENAGEFSALFFRAQRFERRDLQTRWLSPTPDLPSLGWDAHCKRIVTQLCLFDRETEREIAVWNTHFDHRGAVAQLESAQLLKREIASHLNDKATPLVLCGDFNVSPDSPPLRELLLVLKHSRDLSLAPPEGELATYCGFEAPLFGPQWQIDHVLVSAGWSVEAFRVWPSHSESFPPASDHRAVSVDLALASQ